MVRKIAILGHAPSTMGQTPFDDPEWEIWGLNSGFIVNGYGKYAGKPVPRASAWFELHSVAYSGADFIESYYKNDPTAKQTLIKMGSNLYCMDKRDWLPDAKLFPARELMAKYGDYFNNSISWMIAFALHEGATHIGLWGVEMAVGDEYGHQRPSCEYYIGLARGMGVDVYIPPQSDLLFCVNQYGLEAPPRITQKLDADYRDIKKKYSELSSEIAFKEKEKYFMEGAMKAMDGIRQRWWLENEKTKP